MYLVSKNTFLHCNEPHPALRHSRSKSWTEWPSFYLQELMEGMKDGESPCYYKIQVDDARYSSHFFSHSEELCPKPGRAHSVSSLMLPDSVVVENFNIGRKVCVTKMELERQNSDSTRCSHLSKASSSISFGLDSPRDGSSTGRSSVVDLAEVDLPPFGLDIADLGIETNSRGADIAALGIETPSLGVTTPSLGVASPSLEESADLCDVETPKKRKEHRTTIMVKNIPCRYTQQELFEEMTSLGFKFNFMYLPHASRSPKTLGYGFINLLTPEDATSFLDLMDGYTWRSQPNSVKMAHPVYANIQGLRKNVLFYSKRKGVKPKYRPWTSEILAQ